MSAHFEIASELPVEPAAVLACVNLDGVNAELMPLVRMTAPSQWRNQSILNWPTQRSLFGSWILLFGFLPIDLHRFRLESVDADSGFQEHSSSWMNKSWRHQRLVEQTAGGCRVTDRVQFVSRLALLALLLRPMYRLVFWHRHQRLKRRFCRTVD